MNELMTKKDWLIAIGQLAAAYAVLIFFGIVKWFWDTHIYHPY